MGACCATTQGIKDKKKNTQGKLENANKDVPKNPPAEPMPGPQTNLKPEPIPKNDVVVEESTEPEIIEEIQEDLGDLEWYTRYLPNHQRKIEMLHFSDANNIEETSQYSNERMKYVNWGGAARFKRAFDLYRSKDKLVFFSGDLFFPSKLSAHSKGEHMIEAFNQLNVDVACIGNNDIAMGIDHTADLIKKTNCTWILSNIVDQSKEGKPICGVAPYHVIDHQGAKVGVVGFAEEALLDQLTPEVDNSKLEYLDYSDQFEEMAENKLKEEQNCNFVVSLNRLRMMDDINMAKMFGPPMLDMVLGGNEDMYYRELFDESSVFVQKSGTDFQDFTNMVVLDGVSPEGHESYMDTIRDKAEDIGYDMSKLEVFYSNQQQRMIISERVPVDDRFAQELQMQKYVQKCLREYHSSQESWAGSTGPALEGRDSFLRKQETNLGNMIADLVRTEFDADIALLLAGMLKANAEIPHGPFTWQAVEGLLPDPDYCFKINIKGSLLLQILQKVVKTQSDECFPLISGLKFEFDPLDKIMPIIKDSIIDKNGNKFDLDRMYSVVINKYISDSEHSEYAPVHDVSVKKLNYTKNDEKDLRDIVTYFLKSFQKTEEQHNNSPQPSKELLTQRMELFKASFDNRCPVTGFMFLNPETDGRLVRLGDPEPIVIDDQQQQNQE